MNVGVVIICNHVKMQLQLDKLRVKRTTKVDNKQNLITK